MSIENYIEGFEILQTEIDKTKEKTEYLYRLYCSRSYYAIYNFIVEQLDLTDNYKEITNQDEYSNMGVHKRLEVFLRNKNDRELRRAIYRIKAMKANRVKADYNIDDEMTARDYQQSKNQYQSLKTAFA